jgi:hypothetical protein
MRKQRMIFHQVPIQIYTEPGDSIRYEPILKNLHSYVSEKYPHLANVKPKFYHKYAHIMVTYQIRELDNYQLGDMKTVFYIDDIKNIEDFIWAIYAEFEVDSRSEDSEIYDAIATLFNTWSQWAGLIKGASN